MKNYNFFSYFILIFIFLAQNTSYSDSGLEHQQRQSLPIALGVTGSNINDSSKRACCSGTLGALVTNIQGDLFILSNNHVLANTNRAEIGDPVIHPGLIDQERTCNKNSEDVIANLFNFVPISFAKGALNKLDAAIAKTDASSASEDIIDIGAVNSETAAPVLDMAVKKSGRTSGLTNGVVSAVDVTVDVQYSGCGGGKKSVGRFTDQIFISQSSSTSFSGPGDSGSLIVEDSSLTPRPIGLLFAGSSTITVATPIDTVLGCLGVNFIGGTETTPIDCTPAAGGDSGGGGKPGKGKPRRGIPEHVFEKAKKVKAKFESKLFEAEGVIGVGIGFDNDKPVIEVFRKKGIKSKKQSIPGKLDGFNVRIRETGTIIAH